MRRSGVIFFLQVAVLMAASTCNPIFVRWDEFALCLRRRLKRNFSPNVVCATRKMASNFRRTIRCPSCELFFHCQANYEAVFHCSQASEALQTAEVFSDCREFAQFGGPASGVSARQEANLVGRRGGDCVEEYLTKAPNFSLMALFGLGISGRCQWNPFLETCASNAGEVIASADYPPLPTSTLRPETFHRPTYMHHKYSQMGSSEANNKLFSLTSLINFTQPLLSGLGQKPPQKSPGIIETLQALHAIKDKLPVFNTGSSSHSTAPHAETNDIIHAASYQNEPHTAFPVNDSGKPYNPLVFTVQPLMQSTPITNSLDAPGVADNNSNNVTSTSLEPNDPWLSGIALALGSFFGKPPVLPGNAKHFSNPEAQIQVAYHQRPEPVPIPLNPVSAVGHTPPATLSGGSANKVTTPNSE
ncbi:uncharacterized protein LOC111255156 isoform X1 [Varroa destructor]|uniref:Uncharacterized protein n=1 Tax=Varroa destructor TaxID=109461 RepID=A0A7M7KVC6_VARDE|nr:uncharacterized protein LOC111255156 isoform X1 [Varroa destructor]XP_022672555.1 uncharacterized protein LOC111255156 isoform X1 [Varroa destructor]